MHNKNVRLPPIEEAETLLGRPFLSEAGVHDISELVDSDELGFRFFIYRACCNMIESAKAKDRAIAARGANFNAKHWDEARPTKKRLGKFATFYEQEVSFLRQQLQLADYSNHYMHEHWDELTGDLEDEQKDCVKEVVSSLNKAPSTTNYLDANGVMRKNHTRSATVEIPTEAHDSLLPIVLTRIILESHPHRNNRIVHVVASTASQDRLKNKLIEALAHIQANTSSMKNKRALTANIVVTTYAEFAKRFQRNHFDNRVVDFVTIYKNSKATDHRLLEEALVTQWRGFAAHIITNSELSSQKHQPTTDLMSNVSNEEPAKLEPPANRADTEEDELSEHTTEKAKPTSSEHASQELGEADFALKATHDENNVPDEEREEAPEPLTNQADIDVNVSPEPIQEKAEPIQDHPFVEAKLHEEHTESLSNLLEGYSVSQEQAALELCRAGFALQAAYDELEDDGWLVYTCPAEAKTYIAEHFVRYRMLTQEEMADQYNVPLEIIACVIDNPVYNIKAQFIGRSGESPAWRYDGSDQAKIIQALASPSKLGLALVHTNLVAQREGISFEAAWQKKLATSSLFANRDLPPSKNDLPEMKLQQKPLAAIASEVGVAYRVAEQCLTPQELSLSRQRRYFTKSGEERVGIVLPTEIVPEVIERVKQHKPQKLPAYLLPAYAVKQIIHDFNAIPFNKLMNMLIRNSLHQESIILGTINESHRIECFRWQVIAHLEKIRNKTSPLPPLLANIDYGRLPENEYDLNPNKIRYAQELQHYLLHTEELQDYS